MIRVIISLNHAYGNGYAEIETAHSRNVWNIEFVISQQRIVPFHYISTASCQPPEIGEKKTFLILRSALVLCRRAVNNVYYINIGVLQGFLPLRKAIYFHM